jgi:N-methylhydantoinase B
MAVGHRTPVPPNCEVKVRQLGGGGWGDPLERDAERVRDDVLDEYVSRQSARADYGVVLRDDLSLDRAATDALRGEIAASRASHNGDGQPRSVADARGEAVLLTDLTVFATGAP